MKIALVSGGRPTRFQSHINHGVYASMHGFSYYWDTNEYDNLQTPHFHKIAAILQVIDKYDWVMWLDDDAYFTDFNFDVRSIIDSEQNEKFFIVCNSPINPKGGRTLLNSGVFFIKNCAEGRKFLTDSMNVPKSRVSGRWNYEKYGFLTGGEQAHIIHIIHEQKLFEKISIHDWSDFNARPYHWAKDDVIQKYPIIHFAVGDKKKAIDSFSARYGLDNTLVPTNIPEHVRVSVTEKLENEHFIP